MKRFVINGTIGSNTTQRTVETAEQVAWETNSLFDLTEGVTVFDRKERREFERKPGLFGRWHVDGDEFESLSSALFFTN